MGRQESNVSSAIILNQLSWDIPRPAQADLRKIKKRAIHIESFNYQWHLKWDMVKCTYVFRVSWNKFSIKQLNLVNQNTSSPFY